MTEIEKPPKNTILVVHSDERIAKQFAERSTERDPILAVSPQKAQETYKDKGYYIRAVIVNPPDGIHFIRGLKKDDPSMPVIGYSADPKTQKIITALKGLNDGFVINDGKQSVDHAIGEARRLMDRREKTGKFIQDFGNGTQWMSP